MNQQQQPNRQIQKFGDAEIERLNAQLEEISQSCAIELVNSLPVLKQSFALARGMQQLRRLLNDEVMREVFMPLMGSRLGFRTDRDNDPPEKRYPPHVVRECLIEATLRGVRPVGNEFNIIANNFYQTVEGYERKVSELPISELELRPGSIRPGENNVSLVEYRGSWIRNGQHETLECVYTKTDERVIDERIPVRVNNGMGPDAVLGKAKRKYLARLYSKITGVRSYDGDTSDPIETQGVTVASEPQKSQADKLAAEAAARRERRGSAPQPQPQRQAAPTREPGDDE